MYPIIAFRGSACAQDWVTNGTALRISTVVGRVHLGFWNSFGSVLDQVLRLDQREEPAPVVLTGHSKGAAEALLCAVQLARRGRPVAAVVTFGGPRVGDAAWREAYDNQVAIGGNPKSDPSSVAALRRVEIRNPKAVTLRDVTWRFVNQGDCVPRLPTWLRGWRHVGREVFFPIIGGMRVRPSLWFKLISDLAGCMVDFHLRKVSAVMDHPVAKYVSAVGKA